MRPWSLLAAGTIAAAAFAAGAAAAPPSVSATAYILVNPQSEEILVERAADRRLPMASTTKIMTAIVTLERTKLTDTVVVPRTAASAGGSSSGLVPGERLSVRTLLTGLMIASGNDASIALADHVGRGSEARFVRYMNAEARDMRLTNTRFANPHGLDQEGHYSTARDVVKLARAAFRNPVIRQTSSLRSVVIDGITFESTDDLAASLPELIGGKTGHTLLAGWSEVAAAQGRGVAVYAAVLGADSRESRDADLEALLRWGLAEYVPIAAVSAERVYAEAETAYGKPSVQLVAPRTIVRAARLDRSLVERVVAPTRVSLPVRKGQRLGEVKVFDGSRLVASSALVAASEVAAPGFFGRLGWYAERTVHHLVGFVT